MSGIPCPPVPLGEFTEREVLVGELLRLGVEPVFFKLAPRASLEALRQLRDGIVKLQAEYAETKRREAGA